MTLVQNHPQPSNGNKNVVILLLCFFVLSSCGIFTSEPTQRKSTQSDRYTYKPKKGAEWIRGKPIDRTKKQAKEEKAPETTVVKEKEEVRERQSLKDYYNVLTFIPFKTNRYLMDSAYLESAKNIKYLDYYAGMKLAAEKLEQEGVDLIIDVFDTQENPNLVSSIVEQKIGQTDLIMAPLKKTILLELAEQAKSEQIPLVSPWYSSRSIAKDNPYYLQLTPFLTQHYSAIASHALKNFQTEQIFLVGRDGTKDISRFKYFQEVAQLEERQFEIFNLNPQELTYEYEIIKTFIQENTKKDEPVVFILPNFSRKNDSKFIYNFLRRLNVEKLNREVYVYGMPLIQQLDRITYEYMTNLNIRIAVSRFVDVRHQELASFKVKFFNRYNQLPSLDAYEGYDNMLFVGRMLKKHGRDFLAKLDEENMDYFTTSFDIRPIKQDPTLHSSPINYFENSGIRIIKFVEDQFQIAE